MKLLLAWTLLSTSVVAVASETAEKAAVTYCTCERNPEADWWWDGHDLVLYVLDASTGKKTRHLLEGALDSLRACKAALPKNPACLRH